MNVNVQEQTHWRRTLFAMLTFVFASGVCASTSAQEVVNTNRATDMRAAPDDAAAVVQMLPPQSKLQVLERRGAWTRVKGAAADAPSGWVRMMHLRGEVAVEQSAPPSSGGFLGGVNRLLGGSKQTNTRAQSATLGIRGLSPEELQAAQPNPQALAKTKSFAATKPDAEQFAKEASLAKADVPELGVEPTRGARR
jgi:hypothetical protein